MRNSQRLACERYLGPPLFLKQGLAVSSEPVAYSQVRLDLCPGSSLCRAVLVEEIVSSVEVRQTQVSVLTWPGSVVARKEPEGRRHREERPQMHD